VLWIIFYLPMWTGLLPRTCGSFLTRVVQLLLTLLVLTCPFHLEGFHSKRFPFWCPYRAHSFLNFHTIHRLFFSEHFISDSVFLVVHILSSQMEQNLGKVGMLFYNTLIYLKIQ
jgi:hypothetical protein